MIRVNILIMRLILGAGFAVFLSRFFYPDANPVYVAGLGAFMVGMAYVLEYWRGKKPGENDSIKKP